MMSNNSIESKVIKLLSLESNSEDSVCKDIDAFVNSETLDEGIARIINELIEELRNYYMENDSEMYKFNDDFYPEIINKLSEIVKSTLLVYDAFSIIRNYDLQKSIKLLDEIFEKCILRRDLDYLNEVIIEEYDFDKSQLRKLINAFRAAVYDCVSKLLSEASIKKSFELNTGIDPILTNSISQNIDAHFMELKINYIINNLPDFE